MERTRTVYTMEPRDDMPYFHSDRTILDINGDLEFQNIFLTEEQKAINYCLNMGKDHDEAIKNLWETIAQQSETINKLQQEIRGLAPYIC